MHKVYRCGKLFLSTIVGRARWGKEARSCVTNVSEGNISVRFLAEGSPLDVAAAWMPEPVAPVAL